MFEHITASEIAGYTVGALLLSATVSATKIDALISSSQRSSLGMCKRCGDVKLIACPKCKGAGLIKHGEPFTLLPVLDQNRPFPLRSNSVFSSSSSCKNCRARGSFPCPECSN